MYMPAHIPQVLASPDGQRRLRGILVGKGSPTRTEIARRVCKAFKFFDARGALRLSSCRAALTTLARKGVISLPASLSPRRAPARPRSLDRPVRAAREVPNRVDRIAWLRLLRVTTAPQQRVWNRLMQDEHAQGAVRHAGHQLRYLVLSPHGLVGAAGFAAAAPQLAARDAWIGWDPAARTAHMHQVIALSRFLVRPGLACDNLASCVLAMLLRRVSNDFEEQHGFRPVLIETFASSCFSMVQVGVKLLCHCFKRVFCVPLFSPQQFYIVQHLNVDPKPGIFGRSRGPGSPSASPRDVINPGEVRVFGFASVQSRP